MSTVQATREHHPAVFRCPVAPARDDWGRDRLQIPRRADRATIEIAGRAANLTNLQKLFWPDLGITKRDLLQYYADVSWALLPHLTDRAMVMKRYPNGAGGSFFFMKHAPTSRPDWIPICSIRHSSENVVDFPVVYDLPTLLWVVNLGCIDLNQWYARCDDVDRPDFLHFDLDPTPGATFDQVRETALIVRDSLQSVGARSYAKTTGSKGIHVYVPILRKPTQKQVWSFAKSFAQVVARQHPDLITAEYRVAERPKRHVLVDYNQNAWGRTLASVYSVRPRPLATVSTPVTWEEVERGIQINDFRIDNVPARIEQKGDLWKPLIDPNAGERFDLEAAK